MGLPQISILFKSTGISAIKRSDRGIVALVFKDGGVAAPFEVTGEGDIPVGVSAYTKEQIGLALKGGVNAVKKVVVYCLPVEAVDYTAALTYFETVKFDYLAIPGIDSADCVAVGTWAKGCRANLDKMIKVVLPNYAGDSEAVINFATDGIIVDDTTFATKDYCARIAGVIAGTPLTISATYFVLPEVTDVPRLTKTELDTAIDAGKLVLFNDGEKVKIARAVNSLTTITADKGEDFKKIKIVDILDLIHDDIKRTAEDNYIGKYGNSYDNKCLLISAIKGYFDTLESTLLESGQNSIGVNVEAQRTYLTSIGVDVSALSEQAVKEANTGSKVFLASKLSILDAIEDIGLNVVV
jgi:hypothetical protein